MRTIRQCTCGKVHLDELSRVCKNCGLRLPQVTLNFHQSNKVIQLVHSLGGVIDDRMWNIPTWQAQYNMQPSERILGGFFSPKLVQRQPPTASGSSPLVWFQSGAVSSSPKHTTLYPTPSVLFGNSRMFLLGHASRSIWYEDLVPLERKTLHEDLLSESQRRRVTFGEVYPPRSGVASTRLSAVVRLSWQTHYSSSPRLSRWCHQLFSHEDVSEASQDAQVSDTLAVLFGWLLEVSWENWKKHASRAVV